MKNKWQLSLLVISFSLFSVYVFGADPGITIGAKVGANLSNIYDSQTADFQADSKLGLAAGGFITIPIGDFLGVQPELLFSQRGLQGSGKILLSNYSFTRTTNHIDVPILLAIKPIPFLTLLVGPQYSYLISQSYKFNSGLINIDQQDDFKNENIRHNTFCVTGGFDVNLSHFVISARVGWDLMDNNGDGTSSTPRYKNTWTQATVGFKL